MKHFKLLFVTIELLILRTILDIFYLFFYGKNSKLNFQNVREYENYWKHKYDNIYVEIFFF